jgi:predicted double-glycine peptidase
MPLDHAKFGKEELVTELMIIQRRTRTPSDGARFNKSKGLTLGRERRTIM